ncbi:TA system toxin CbtA family protein, partial [Escherichia coli]
VKVARCFHDHTGWFNNIRRNILMATRSQLINSIDILRARRATGLMTRDNYRTVNNITLGKYPEAK